MKILSFITAMVFCLPSMASASFPQNKSEVVVPTENLVSVNRWYHPQEKDWVSLTESESEEWKLGSSGYQDKTYSFKCSKEAFSDSVAVYRWYHPQEKDWVTNAEVDTNSMERSGYTYRTFQCFGSLTPIPNGIAVYRWYHPQEKDWVTLVDGATPDSTLRRWGYQYKTFLYKTFLFYAWR